MLSGLFDSYDNAAKHIIRAGFYMDAALARKFEVSKAAYTTLENARLSLTNALKAVANPLFSDFSYSGIADDCDGSGEFHSLAIMSVAEMGQAMKIAEEERWPFVIKYLEEASTDATMAWMLSDSNNLS